MISRKVALHALVLPALLAILLVPQRVFADVDPLSGAFTTRQTDLVVSFLAVEIDVSRSYDSLAVTKAQKTRWYFHPFDKQLLLAQDDGEVFLRDGPNVILFQQSKEAGVFLSQGNERISRRENEFVRTLKTGVREVYNTDGRLIRIIRPDGKNLTLSYDKGLLATVLLDDRELLRHIYNKHGLIAEIRGYNGTSSHYQYDAKGFLIRATNADHLVTSYGYDDRGRLTSITYHTGDFLKLQYSGDTGIVDSVIKREGITRYEYERGRTGRVSRVTIRHPWGVHKIDIDDDGRLIKAIDVGGQVTQRHFDPNGLLTRFVDARGNSVTYVYDADRRLVEIRYPDNGIVRYRYLDGTSFVTRQTLPDGSQIMLTYNDQAQVVHIAGAGAPEISIRYNQLGLVDTIYHGRERKRWTKYEYDPHGFLIGESDALGRTITYKRDGKGRMIERVDPLGRRLTYTYNPHGLLTQVSEGSRIVLSKRYDNQLRLTHLTDASGLTTSFAYDPNGNLASVVYPNGRKELFQYNPYGWLQSIADSPGGRSSFEYNALGEVTKRIAPDGAAADYRYDPLGNVLELHEPNGVITKWEYDAMGRLAALVQPGGMTHRYSHDTAGQLVTERDPLGHAKTYSYDRAGNLKRVLLPGGEQTSYEYDSDGFLLTARTADKREYRYVYDQAGRLVGERTPWNEVIEYAYDAADRLVKKTSSGGSTIEYSYDAADRLIGLKTSDGLRETFQHDARGNLVEIRGKDFVKKLSYSRYGELTAEEYPLLGKAVKHTYDSRGNRLSLEVPGHLKIDYTYDTADRLTGVTYQGGKRITLAYDALGRKAEISYANGIKMRYSYDNMNLLEEINYIAPSGNVIQRYRYAHEKDGRVKRITDLKGHARTFAYDPNGQLIEAAADEKVTFTYAESFKKVSQKKRSAETQFAYNPAGQLVRAGKTTVTYDASGNLSRKDSPEMDQQFRFDALGRLAEIQTPSNTIRYGYSPEGQRVTKDAGNTKTFYVYDGLNLLMVLNQRREPIQTFVHAGEIDSPLVLLEGNDALFYLRDHQGSIIALADGSGEVVVEYEYEPFGKVTTKGAERNNPLTYTGRFYDPESGLYYYRARYYDPELGVFLSPDPYPKSLTSPQSFSEYAYVYNDPMNLVDPLGLNGYSHMWSVLERGGHATPQFLRPTILRPESATSASFWQRMAEDYAFLRREFGHGTAENFRRQLTDQLARLYQPQTTKPGILEKVYEGLRGLASRVGRGAGAIGEGIRGGGERIAQGIRGILNPGIQRQPTLAGTGPKAPGNVTIKGPINPGQAAVPPTGYSALTEGKSSFQHPSLLGRAVTELNRPVSGGEIGGGVLTGALVGWQVGSRYAEEARREGRNLTPGEYAKSAAESAARAAVSVVTAGASEGLVSIGEFGSEVIEGRKARQQAEEAQKAYERAQRMAAERIRAFAAQAASLVQEAGAMERDQDNAIAEAKNWYQKTEHKLEEINGLQTIADNQELCRQCRSRVETLNGLQAEAESYKEPVTGNRDIAKQRADLVCPPIGAGTEADVDMARNAAGLAKGQASGIKRVADKAKSIQSEIAECTARIQANNDAIADAASTLKGIEGIKAAVASNKAKVEEGSVRVKSFVGKCQAVQGRISRIHGIAQASPGVVVVAVSADGPHEIIDTGPAKQQIANSVNQINDICSRISSRERHGETYVGYHDAVEQSIQAKAQTLEAKIRQAKPCAVQPPPPGFVENLSALAGAAEVLATYAEADAMRAVQCLAQATEPVPPKLRGGTRAAGGRPEEGRRQPWTMEGFDPRTDPGMGGGAPDAAGAEREAGRVIAAIPQAGRGGGGVERGGGLGGGAAVAQPSAEPPAPAELSPEEAAPMPPLAGVPGQTGLEGDPARDRPTAAGMMSGREAPQEGGPSGTGPPAGGAAIPRAPAGPGTSPGGTPQQSAACSRYQRDLQPLTTRQQQLATAMLQKGQELGRLPRDSRNEPVRQRLENELTALQRQYLENTDRVYAVLRGARSAGCVGPEFDRADTLWRQAQQGRAPTSTSPPTGR